MLASEAVARLVAACATVRPRAALVEQGATAIVRTSAFTKAGVDSPFLEPLRAAWARAPHHRARFQEWPHRGKRLQEATQFTPKMSCARSNPIAPAFSAPMSTEEGMLQARTSDGSAAWRAG